MEKKYKALRILIWVYRLAAGVIFLFGLVYGGVNQLYGIIVGAVILALSIYGFGELITLLIDLEENTRASTKLLMRLARSKD